MLMKKESSRQMDGLVDRIAISILLCVATEHRPGGSS